MEPVLTVFVAGSKELKEERKVCRSVCNVLQNQWGPIVTKTFEDFPETLSTDSHQHEYNTFICEEADVVIFVFSGTVGDKTLDELKEAYHSYKHHGHPKILVYFDIADNSRSKEIETLKRELGGMGQYYKEYSDVEDLERKVEKHLNKILIAKTKHQRGSDYWDILKGLGALVGTWLFLCFLGGIGMYIYDRNMSEDASMSLVVKYIEYGKSGELMYYLPDKLYIYDTRQGELSIIERHNASSSIDITWPKIEHAALGVTVTLLMARMLKFTPKNNGKQALGYIAAAVGAVAGVGVGCVVEQMLFPPQYSKPVRDLLDNPSNWETINLKRNPSNWF